MASTAMMAMMETTTTPQAYPRKIPLNESHDGVLVWLRKFAFKDSKAWKESGLHIGAVDRPAFILYHYMRICSSSSGGNRPRFSVPYCFKNEKGSVCYDNCAACTKAYKEKGLESMVIFADEGGRMDQHTHIYTDKVYLIPSTFVRQDLKQMGREDEHDRRFDSCDVTKGSLERVRHQAQPAIDAMLKKSGPLTPWTAISESPSHQNPQAAKNNISLFRREFIKRNGPLPKPQPAASTVSQPPPAPAAKQSASVLNFSQTTASNTLPITMPQKAPAIVKHASVTSARPVSSGTSSSAELTSAEFARQLAAIAQFSTVKANTSPNKSYNLAKPPTPKDNDTNSAVIIHTPRSTDSDNSSQGVMLTPPSSSADPVSVGNTPKLDLSTVKATADNTRDKSDDTNTKEGPSKVAETEGSGAVEGETGGMSHLATFLDAFRTAMDGFGKLKDREAEIAQGLLGSLGDLLGKK